MCSGAELDHRSSSHAVSTLSAPSMVSAQAVWPPASLKAAMNASCASESRRPGAFNSEGERNAPVPDQEIRSAGEHTHALELGAGDLVAAPTVCGMKPEHVG